MRPLGSTFPLTNHTDVDTLLPRGVDALHPNPGPPFHRIYELAHRAASGDSRLHRPPNASLGPATRLRHRADDSRKLERRPASRHRFALPRAAPARAQEVD